jgi:hypothetical protein
MSLPTPPFCLRRTNRSMRMMFGLKLKIKIYALCAIQIFGIAKNLLRIRRIRLLCVRGRRGLK